MYCAYCGAEVHQGQSFCSRCGRAVAASTVPAPGAALGSPSAYGPAGASATASPGASQAGWTPAPGYTPVQSRLRCHLRTLGILWIVGCVLRLIPSLGMLLFGRIGFLFLPVPARAFVLPIVGGLGAFLTVASVAGIAAGWGLIDRRPWARSLAIVLGCLALIDFPFGTALGIYTLWVLLSAGADVEYDRLSNRVIG
jgi:hypothetical protein